MNINNYVLNHIINLIELSYSIDEIKVNLLNLFNIKIEDIILEEVYHSNKIFDYIYSGDFMAFYKVLKKYPNAIKIKNKKGLTPFLFSIKNKKYDFSTQLIFHGSDINAFDFSQNNAFIFLVESNEFDYLEFLLGYNIDLNFVIDDCLSIEFIFKFSYLDDWNSFLKFVYNFYYKFNSENLEYFENNKIKMLLNRKK